MSVQPYLRRIPVIPARSLIPGRKEPTFPGFCRIEEKPVTFRREDAHRSREERERYLSELSASLRGTRLVLLLIPDAVYANPETLPFIAGWTVIERDDEFLTRQCVVLRRADAVPVGRADQGVLCLARQAHLSAWNGLTEDQNRLQAA